MEVLKVERRKQEELEKLFSKLEATYLTKEARERLNFLKLTHPEMVEKFRVFLLTAVQSGKMKVIDEAELKQILSRLSEKKEGKIKFVRK
ncbi:MAG: DNA-binding protein [Candidatus Parvarchaeota archaeon]|nr:DNA-binding protein [Candidatus Haiyanarchaeum thermophilum]MCW1307393.1 DNA-binding protein [Candidatus Haiyanarchaeum thermophilum]